MLKAVSGKFMPLKQWMCACSSTSPLFPFARSARCQAHRPLRHRRVLRYFDATELLPPAELELPESEFAPVGSRHDAQIHVLGGVSRLVAMLDGSLIITVSQSTLRVQAEQAALAKEAMQAKVADADVGAEPLSSSTALEGDLKTSKVRRTSAEVIVEASELEAQLRGTAYRPKSVHKVWSIAPNLIDVDENGRAREQIQIASANKMAMQEQSAAALAELAKVRS